MQLVAILGSGIIAAGQEKRIGEIAEAQSVIDANAEGDAGRGREIERKELLRQAIGSQLAATGAGGVAFTEGSPARIAQLDISKAARDLDTDTVNTKAKRRALLLQGKNAATMAKAKSTISLLDTAVKAGDTAAGMMA